jgi:uncharacterized membrane protein YhaH (DUF805 family)
MKVWTVALTIFTMLIFFFQEALVSGIQRMSNEKGLGYSTLQIFTGLGLIQYIAKFFFLLLTPMPWWQITKPDIFVHQVFSYPHTLMSLTVYAAVVFGWHTTTIQRKLFPLMLTGIAILMLATLGSALHNRYGALALPLFLLPAASILREKWGQCIWVSASVIWMVHVMLFFLHGV